jgi:hypothetical protein
VRVVQGVKKKKEEEELEEEEEEEEEEGDSAWCVTRGRAEMRGTGSSDSYC